MQIRESLRSYVVVALVFVLCAPFPAAAGGARISVARVRSDANGAVARQLTGALCRSFECVPLAQLQHNGKLDFRAMKAERVGVLFGTVARARSGPSLELALLTTSLRPDRTWRFRLDRQGRIAPGALDALADDLGRALGGPASAARSSAAPAVARAQAPAPAAVPAAPPARAPEVDLAAEAAPALTGGAPEKSPASSAAPAPARTAAVASSERATRVAAAAPATTVRGPPRDRPTPRSVLAGPEPVQRSHGSVDLGVHVAQRKLAYQGVNAGVGTLQEFSAGGIVSPCAHVELYPFSTVTEGAFADLAAFATYATSIGLETEESAAPGVRHATKLTQLEGGLGWRIRPVASSRAVVVPRVSYRTLSLEVKPAGAGPIAGLPDAHLAGPSVALDVEIPLRDRFGLLLGAGYTRWTTAKDLVGGNPPAFFSGGSAYALDASAGAWIDVAGPLSLRVVAEYSGTRYSLSGSATYVATGASDRYLGLRTTMHLRF